MRCRGNQLPQPFARDVLHRASHRVRMNLRPVTHRAAEHPLAHAALPRALVPLERLPPVLVAHEPARPRAIPVVGVLASDTAIEGCCVAVRAPGAYLETPPEWVERVVAPTNRGVLAHAASS